MYLATGSTLPRGGPRIYNLTLLPAHALCFMLAVKDVNFSASEFLVAFSCFQAMATVPAKLCPFPGVTSMRKVYALFGMAAEHFSGHSCASRRCQVWSCLHVPHSGKPH